MQNDLVEIAARGIANVTPLDRATSIDHAYEILAQAALTALQSAGVVTQGWQDIATFSELTAMSSGNGVLVACADGTVGEAYFRNYGDESDGWWWANTSWGDYPTPDRPQPLFWQPLPTPPLQAARGGA